MLMARFLCRAQPTKLRVFGGIGNSAGSLGSYVPCAHERDALQNDTMVLFRSQPAFAPTQSVNDDESP